MGQYDYLFGGDAPAPRKAALSRNRSGQYDYLFDQPPPAPEAPEVPAAPVEQPSRSIGDVIGDTTIEAGNAIVGTVGAIGNMVSPGNRISRAADELIRKAEANQSPQTQATKKQFREDLENADGILDEAAIAGKYALQNPLLTAANIAGNLVGPGVAVKGGAAVGGAIARRQALRRGEDVAEAVAKGKQLGGTAGGVAFGAAAGGGDAAGQAYELVTDPTRREVVLSSVPAEAMRKAFPDLSDDQIVEKLATSAARDASVVPAIIGGLGGVFGLERALSGVARPAASRVGQALRTGVVEGVEEGLEEGVTGYSGRYFPSQIDPTIDPMKGVGADAALGAIYGGGMGAVGGALAPTQQTLTPEVDPKADPKADTKDPADPNADPLQSQQTDQATLAGLQSVGTVDEDGNPISVLPESTQEDAPTSDDFAPPPDDFAPTHSLPDPQQYEEVGNAIPDRDSQQTDLEQLTDTLGKSLGVTDGDRLDIKLAVAEEVGQQRYELADRMARTLKKLFDVDTLIADFGEDGRMGTLGGQDLGPAVNGAYLNDRRTVLLNARSNDLLKTPIHEIVHALEKTHADLYKPLEEIALKYADKTKVDALNAFLEKAGESEQSRRSELVAEVMAEQANPAMWDELFTRAGESAPSLRKQLLSWLDKLYKAITGQPGFVKEAARVKEIRDQLNDAFTAWQVRTAATRKSAAKSATPAPATAPQTAQEAAQAPAEGRQEETPVEQPTDPEELYGFVRDAVVAGKTRPSTTGIQKAHKIGYEKALRISRRLEKEGVVSAAGERGARTVQAVKPEPVGQDAKKVQPKAEEIPEPTYDEEVNEEPTPQYSRGRDAADAFDSAQIEERRVPGFKSREKLYPMPIRDFLKLAKQDPPVQTKADDLKALRKNGTPFRDIPFLQFWENKNGELQVDGHEGRHRARQLLSEGYETMPVILRGPIRWSEQKDPGRFDYQEKWPKTLLSQDGDVRLPFPVSREQAAEPYNVGRGEQDEQRVSGELRPGRTGGQGDGPVQLSRGRRGGGEPSRGDEAGARPQDGDGRSTPLPGYAHGHIKGAAGPDPALVRVAEEYARKNGLKLRRQAEYVQVDPERAARIAAAYEAMPHAPQDPKVREAYADLIRQTRAQYDALVEAGYVFTFFDSQTDPYQGNPWNAMRDLRANKRMAVYGTYDGYGTEGITGAAIEDNPMLEDTGLRWPDQAGVERPVVANDLFRAVHDAFGHGLEGAGFRAQGEENAWQAHVRLFKGPAVAAITSETRGQNSWLNYGPYAERNQTAALEDTVFAPQKTGLMPEWTWKEGVAEDGDGPQFSRAVQYEVQDAGDAPKFADRPIQPGSAEFVGYHYSTVPRAQLDGRAYGSTTSARQGKEYERVMNAPDKRLRDRVYFYTAPMAEIPRAEPVVTGPQIHKVVLRNIYDTRTADPRLLGKSGNDLESAIINAGYDGYVSHDFGMIVVLGTKPIPVQHIGNRQGLKDQIRANPVMTGAVKIQTPNRAVVTRDGMLTKKPDAGQWVGGKDEAAVKAAAPSFRVEYGEMKVRPEEKEAANAALAEAGNSFQFSRVVDAWQEIAKNDEVFRYPRSEEKDFQELSDAILPGNIKWEDLSGTGYKKWQAMVNEDYMSYALVTQVGKRVWLDVSELKSGKTGGSAIYNLVANYAYNNGLTFIGDPAGLSATGAWRRLSNMISSALKFGTTNHLQPHPNQFNPNGAYTEDLPDEIHAREHLRPINWKDGNTRYNLDQMLRAESESILSAVPEIRGVRYDLASGQFLDPQGSLVPRDAFDRAAEAAASRGTPAGSATLERAVFTHSLLRPVEGSGLGEDGPQLLSAGAARLAGVLYSRPIQYQGQRFTLPERNLRERAANLLTNEMSRAKDVREQVGLQGGALSDDNDVDMQNRLSIRMAGTKVDRFREKVVEPIVRRAAKANIDVNDAALLLYAQHAPERNAYIATINPRFPDGGSGMTNADAAQAIQSLQAKYGAAKFAQLVSIAKDFQQITERTQNVLVTGGLVDPQLATAWNSRYSSYVPLKGFERVDEENKESSNIDPRWDFSKRALGRESKAGQIVENILKDHERAILMVAKNDVRKTFLQFVRDNPDPALWEVNRVVITQQFRKSLGLQSPVGQAQGIVNHVAGINKDRKNTVAVRVGGQLFYISVKDKALLHDLNQEFSTGTPEDAMALVRAWKSINKNLGFLWTALSPVFVATNFIRDLSYGTIKTTRDFGFIAGAKVLGNSVRAIPSIWKAVYTGNWTGGASEYERWFNEFREQGGAMGIVSQLSVDEQHNRLMDAFRAYEGAVAKDPKTWGRPALKALNATKDFIVNANSGIEQAVRVAAYAEARKRGESPKKAADIAANVTVDFARRGKIGSFLGSLYLFYNPAVQGTANLMQVVRGKRGAAVVGSLIALGFMWAAMASSAEGEDDEPYWDAPNQEQTKIKNLVWYSPTGDRYSIPIPYGMGFFVNLGYAMHDLYRGRDPWAVSKFVLSSFTQHFSPLGSPENPVTFVAPTIVDPVAVAFTEKREDGKPLMPKDFVGNTPDSERYWTSSRGTLTQQFASWVNEVTGGNSSRSGAVDVSPETINYLTSFVTGGAGTFARDIWQAMDLTINVDGDAALDKNKWPVLRSFYRKADGRSYQSSFYENATEIEKAVKEMKEQAFSDDDATQERIASNAGIASMGKLLNSVKKKIGDLRKEEVSIIDSDMTKAEKEAARKDIEEQRQQLYIEFNRLFYSVTPE